MVHFNLPLKLMHLCDPFSVIVHVTGQHLLTFLKSFCDYLTEIASQTCR